MLASRDGGHFAEYLTNAKRLGLKTINNRVDVLKEDPAPSLNRLDLLKRDRTFFFRTCELTAATTTFAAISIANRVFTDGSCLELLL